LRRWTERALAAARRALDEALSAGILARAGAGGPGGPGAAGVTGSRLRPAAGAGAKHHAREAGDQPTCGLSSTT
jgi:hypothetical protein